MKDQLKWVLNHMPKSDDQHLDVMSLPNVAKARSFHGSFPQYSITPLAQLDGMAQYLGLAGVYVKDESYRFGLNAFKVLGGSFAMARYIAKELGVELEIVPLEWSAVLTGVGAGKYDMAVAGMAYTPERAETMAMSKVYKPGGDQGLLVPADKVDEYTSLADFAGKKVGFQSGTVQEQNVLTQLPDSEPVTFDIIQNAVLALDSGKVDAVSVSIANGEMFVSTNPKLAVSTVQFDNSQNGNVIGFPKGETELVDAVNKIIDEVLEQGLYDQWLEEATAEAENLGL